MVSLWTLLGTLWGHVGPFWCPLASIWTPLGGFLAHVGLFCGILVSFWSLVSFWKVFWDGNCSQSVVKAARSAAEDHLTCWQRCKRYIIHRLGLFWTNGLQCSEASNSICALPVPLLRQVCMRSFSWAPLTENDGRGNAYLDGWALGRSLG